MAWLTRFTRFGDMHALYGQEAVMSCGIASGICQWHQTTAGDAPHVPVDQVRTFGRAGE
jgi:hypothetical protein